MRVWVDCTAAAHPLVLRPIIERLEAQGHEVFVTAREYGQTMGILERLGMPYTVGRQHGGASPPAQGPGAGRPLGAAGAAGLGAAARPGDRPRLGRPRGRLGAASASPRCRCRTTSSPACSARSPSGWRAGCWCRTRSRSSGWGGSAPRSASWSAIPGLKEEYYLADFEPDPAVLDELGPRPREGAGRRAAAAGDLRVPRPQRPLRRAIGALGRGAGPVAGGDHPPHRASRGRRRGRSAPPT